MLYESPHLRVTTDDGVATLWLAFPGSPVNALSAARVAEIGRALDAVLDNPHLDALVIRSGLPAGFCGGYVPGTLAGIVTDEDATAFAFAGQRVFARLVAAEMVTIAFIEGPCLGPGMELALACDYRLAVAGPDSAFGFPDAVAGIPPCWGGPTRLRQMTPWWSPVRRPGSYIFMPAEAKRYGLIDHKFSQRRGKIELRTWLDGVQARPRKRRPIASGSPEHAAAERTALRAALRKDAVREWLREGDGLGPTHPGDGVGSPLPNVVAILGTAEMEFALEVAIRGGRVVVAARPEDNHITHHPLSLWVKKALGEGRVTPLEAEQASARIEVTPNLDAIRPAELVLSGTRHSYPISDVLDHVGPATVVFGQVAPEDCTYPQVVRGGLWGIGHPIRRLAQAWPGEETSSEALAALAAWLPQLGYRAVVRPVRVAEVAPELVAA